MEKHAESSRWSSTLQPPPNTTIAVHTWTWRMTPKCSTLRHTCWHRHSTHHFKTGTGGSGSWAGVLSPSIVGPLCHLLGTSTPASQHALAGMAPCGLALASHTHPAPPVVSHEENHICVFMGHTVFGRVLTLHCVP